MTCYKNGGCCVYENRSCYECPASKPEYLNRNESKAIATTLEYLAGVAEDETNVQKATDFLERLGIRVKTEYGNYRPTYDVLRDIGDAMSRA